MAVSSYTISEVENMDGHVELVNGILSVEDKAAPMHNSMVGVIATALRNYISQNHGSCSVFTDSVALYCNDEKNYYMPDIMVVCNKDKIQKDGVHDIPLFIVEVTSEETKKYDYADKMMMYKKMGVQEYWIVDIQKNTILKYLSFNEYVPEIFVHPKEMEVSVYPGLTITLEF